MDRDLAGPGVTTGGALAAIAGALPAVEIVDSRVADWKIKLVDTVADNASSGLLVVGGRMRNGRRSRPAAARRRGLAARRGHRHRRRRRRPWQPRTLRRLAGEQAGQLRRRACAPGDIVLPGAVHKMVPVTPGDVFRADFAHLGGVTVRFSGQEADDDRDDGPGSDRAHASSTRRSSVATSPRSAIHADIDDSRLLTAHSSPSCSRNSMPVKRWWATSSV